MRGWLILLALAVPVVLASPWFWSIVRMDVAAERVGYTHADGATQWARLGPKAPWPDWALVPAGAALAVKAHFEAAPGRIATGHAALDLPAPPAAAQAAFARAAAEAGWEVRMLRQTTTMPELSPRPVLRCLVEARREGRSLQLALEPRGTGASGMLFWFDRTPAPMPAVQEGGC